LVAVVGAAALVGGFNGATTGAFPVLLRDRDSDSDVVRRRLGLSADSEEKHEPVSDIDIAAAESESA
jgi:hypothetical protein